MSKYLVSKIDGKTYCVSNGQWKRHLDSHDLTFQTYWEQYETGIKPICPYCKNPKTFYQSDQSYAQTCGSKVCYGHLIRDIKAEFTVEKNQEINAKRSSTNLEKYGTDIAVHSPELKKRVKATRLAVQADGRIREDHIQDAVRASKLVKYGDAFYNNSKQASQTRINKSVEEKSIESAGRRQTLLDRYGVENIFQLPQNLNRTAKGNASIKDITLPSGKIIGTRGWEPDAIAILLASYLEADLMISDSRNPATCGMPVFTFVDTNLHNKRYFPDIYIPSQHLIIEVKSRWWYDACGRAGYESRLKNNTSKKQSAIDAGYNFEFWIFNSKDSYEVI